MSGLDCLASVRGIDVPSSATRSMRDRLPSMRTLKRKVMSRFGPCTVELILGVDSIRMACARQICVAQATGSRISNRRLRWEKANKASTSHLHLQDRQAGAGARILAPLLV